MKDEKIIARIEQMCSDGQQWDCAMLKKQWHGKPPSKQLIASTVRQMIGAGRLITNGLEGRGRKFITNGKSLAVPEVQAEDVPRETPVIVAIYPDRAELPLSSLAELLGMVS